jgi:hypothetical protein
MTRILKSLALILIAISPAASVVSAGEEGAYALRDLSWILGTWQMDGRGHTIVETWRQASKHTYEGESYTISLVNNDTTFAESLRMVEMGDAVYYIADVSHNPYPVPFKLVKLKGHSAVFENTTHDFPQIITYTFSSDQTLKVTVAGRDTSSNEDRILEFHYKMKE